MEEHVSRTDKDRPVYAREADPTERRIPSHHHRNWRGEPLDCDLDAPTSQRRNRWNNCSYWIPGITYYPGSPPRWFRRRQWYDPERLRERIDLRAMAREYNAHGDLDDGDFPCWQHRHRARWDWD